MRRGQEVFITQITDRGLVMQYCQRDTYLYMYITMKFMYNVLGFVFSLGACAQDTNVLGRFRTVSAQKCFPTESGTRQFTENFFVHAL
jgi:hypothetical protein